MCVSDFLKKKNSVCLRVASKLIPEDTESIGMPIVLKTVLDQVIRALVWHPLKYDFHFSTLISTSTMEKKKLASLASHITSYRTNRFWEFSLC